MRINASKEKTVEKEIIHFLNAIGGWATKIQSGSIMKTQFRKRTGENINYRIKLADSGTPDILACVSGRFLAIEVKDSADTIEKWWRSYGSSSENDKTAMAQHHHRKIICEAGGAWIIVSSLNDVVEYLNSHKHIFNLQTL